MAEIDIDYELAHVSGILRDVETIDIPWTEQEIAGFDWFMFVWAVGKLNDSLDKMNESQKEQFNAIRIRIDAVKEKLDTLDFTNPFAE